jgi:glycosyltransferase involved in cell wall biosynthesis
MLAKEASNFSANLDAKLVKTSAADAAVSLLIPADDTPEPELSIVVPALNEEVTVGQFVEWCRQGISKAGIRAEIIIVDSSSDRTPEIALAAGARVLRCPKRGLGRAYIDAIPFILGRYVILGDADCTYDFRELRPFLAEFRRGAEFIMGSRFKGTIEEGAMPPLHRYFGTPFTTWILNVMYGTKFSDIHCGMRGITLDAFKRIELSSQGWEYASEMVLKSVHLRLNSAEVPVAFFKDPAGRTSHLIRAGWTAPWKAGWSNLKAMFIFGADCFLMLPGIVLLVASLPLMLALSAGPIYIGEFGASLNTMLILIFTALLGLQMTLIGLIAQCIYDRTGFRRRRWLALFPYTPTVLGCGVMLLLGALLIGSFGAAFIEAGYQYSGALTKTNHHAILGIFLIAAGIEVFVSMLIMQAVAIYVPLPAQATAVNRDP